MTRMNVSFDSALIDEFRRIIPVRQRSRFICDAVREKLLRVQQAYAISKAAGSWSSTGRRSPEREMEDSRATWSDRANRTDNG